MPEKDYSILNTKLHVLLAIPNVMLHFNLISDWRPKFRSNLQQVTLWMCFPANLVSLAKSPSFFFHMALFYPIL